MRYEQTTTNTAVIVCHMINPVTGQRMTRDAFFNDYAPKRGKLTMLIDEFGVDYVFTGGNEWWTIDFHEEPIS